MRDRGKGLDPDVFLRKILALLVANPLVDHLHCSLVLGFNRDHVACIIFQNNRFYSAGLPGE